MANILSIGTGALSAAQIGLATTGHNIANAATPGYSRQTVLQGAVGGESQKYGFPGSGTEVVAIRRIYDQFLGNQVVAAQTSRSQIEGYLSQIQQINGVLADPTAGLSPSMQGMFNGVQALSADPNSAAARQSMLSSAEALASRFQGLDGQLREIGQGVNAQISTSVNGINVLSQKIASLNDAIEIAQAGRTGIGANDLLDQRDQAINDLSKEVKVSVVKQGESYSIFVGNGQPLVVGASTFTLAAVGSKTDPLRTEVAYVANGTTVELAETAFAGGGKLGGTMSFRSETLDKSVNALGRVATALGTSFNAQHALGQDQNGALGGKFFNVGVPQTTASTANTGSGNVVATISNANLKDLGTSDFRVQYVATSYKVTRLSDGDVTNIAPPGGTAYGLDFATSGTPAANDSFLVRPTRNGARDFSVAIKDTSAIAAASPMRSAASTDNTGTVKISPPVINSTAALPGATLKYVATSGTSGTLTGFPATAAVTVTVGGTVTPYFAGAVVPYTSGATYAYGGLSFTMTGAPGNNDTFVIGANTTGQGDSRNAVLLGALQTATLLEGGTTSYQGAYSKLVNQVGNKTRELQTTGAAANNLYTQAVGAQQAQSGVNLDEEATNLLRYQQAYQAAGKLMQTASQLFDVLLSLGR
ncbi:MAG: flagellar hook-associated protein FlgK [Herminiimonas sp.]|nr:flagellar hook-associated protein FlgK [Herminiimonas sp.]